MARAPDTARTRRGVPTRKILVLNGPNLNLLESRETPRSIIQRLSKATTGRALIDRLQTAKWDGFASIFVNTAVFTLSRLALRETLAAVGIPFLEARRSNIHAPEALRRHADFSDLAVGTICGLGSRGCDLALECVLGN